MHSLQSRITASFVIIIAATVLVLGIGGVVLFGQLLQNQYVTTYQRNAIAIDDVMEQNLQADPLLVRNGGLLRVLAVLGPTYHVRIRVTLLGVKPAVQVYDSGPPVAASAQHLEVDRSLGQLFVQLRGNYSQPIAQMELSEPLTDRAYVEEQLLGSVLFAGVGACLLAFAVGGILAARVTAPLRILTQATVQMGAGHLAERVREGGRDEAGDLARQFNRMAARLEESFQALASERDRLRQFVADVSHEVRTPLTALRTFNDLLRDGAGADPATRADFLQESARQIDRLDWLTHNLLDLSRLDAGIIQLRVESADLADTVRRAVAAHEPTAATRPMTLCCTLPSVVVPHDAPRMEQAISNVVGNALKFSPPGSTVHLATGCEGDMAYVEVRDEGPGIPSDEVAHIFDRFYRGRAANRSGEGSGLGLAITKSIVDAHNGTIRTGRAVPTGLVVRLLLPASHEPTPGAPPTRISHTD